MNPIIESPVSRSGIPRLSLLQKGSLAFSTILKLFLGLLILSVINTAQAQQVPTNKLSRLQQEQLEQEVDRAIRTGESDTALISKAIKLTTSLIETNLRKSLYYTRWIYNLSMDLANNKLKAEAFNFLYSYYRELGLFDLALNAATISNDNYIITGDHEAYAFSLNDIGNCYFDKRDYVMSRYFYKKALDTSLKYNSTFISAVSYDNLGLSYALLNQFDSAIYCHKQAVAYRKKHDPVKQIGVGHSYTRLCEIYAVTKSSSLGIVYADSAVAAYSKNGEYAAAAAAKAYSIYVEKLPAGQVRIFKDCIALLDSAYKRNSFHKYYVAYYNIMDGIRHHPYSIPKADVEAMLRDFKKTCLKHSRIRDLSAVNGMAIKYFQVFNDNKAIANLAVEQIQILDSLHRQQDSISNAGLLALYSLQGVQNEVITLKERNRTEKYLNKFLFVGIGIVVLLLVFLGYLAWKQKHKNKLLNEQYITIQDQAKDLAVAMAEAESSSRRALKLAETESRFLNQMSHEIRTPINAISGFAHLYLEKHPGAQDIDFIEKIAETSKHLSSILNNILDYARLKSGIITTSVETLEVRHFLQSTVDMVASSRADRQDVKMKLILPDNFPKYILSDRMRLKQVVINLLSNAFKFTTHGEVTLTVRINPAHSDHFQLIIYDTGIGIDQSKIEEIFQGFVQADESIASTYGGTGLGLAISKQLVALLGGSIQVESKLGVYSQFTLDFPLNVASSPEPMVIAENTASAIEKVKGKSILVAEDNIMNQKVITALLTHWECKVQIVNNGQEFLQALEANTYDLGLLDFQMPVLDGLQTILKLRTSEPKHPGANMPVYLLTADAYSFAKGGQFFDYLQYFQHIILKPIDQVQLLRVMNGTFSTENLNVV